MARNPIPLDANVWGEYLSAQEAKLPRLPDVEQLTARVVRIMGGNPGRMQLQGTNTYLVGTGRSRILIDTGEGKPAWIKNLADYMSSHSILVSHVLLTHWHGDHTGGVPDLLDNPELLLPARQERRHQDSHDGPAAATTIYKHTPDPGQEAIEDGQVFAVEGATVRAVFTPGHAADHCCFVLDEEDALFTGDNVLGHRGGFSVAEDLGAYLASLRRMAGLGCARAYPAHGSVVAEGDLPACIARYVGHWEARERLVLDGLAAAAAGAGGSAAAAPAATAAALARRLYGDPRSEALVEGALEPAVAQVLWKLAEDGRVAFRSVQGERHWFSLKPRVVEAAA